jgi:hypothetical protein
MAEETDASSDTRRERSQETTSAVDQDETDRRLAALAAAAAVEAETERGWKLDMLMYSAW